MSKISTLATGIAMAITFALMSALCAVAFMAVPDATIDFFGAFMHGIDLKAVKSAAPISIARVYLRGDWAWRGGVGRGAGVCLGL